ncbi:uncharacterized protein DDB_G0286299 isoform X2 [Osmerus mordax]|uniref:uncharacterized protein DDB_G0286299 isoform X2 n=1 Tax=Osmerus mordax TaxID=8014 RepID=UPI00350FB460
MAATEVCAAPVQEDGATGTKSEAETAPSDAVNSEVVEKETEVVNKEVMNNEVINDEAAGAETSPAATEEEAKPADGVAEETPAASTEPPAEGKAKPAHDGIWDSFLNKSGLGKVMGGRKKKEPSAGGEEAGAEGAEPQEKVNGEETPAEGAESGAAAAEDQAVENAAEGDEGAEGKKEGKEAKPKHGEKSSVRDMIRKPVARIFSHKSTDKKDAAEGEPQKPVRSKSLDRLEDPEACNAAAEPVDPAEESQVEDAEAQKPSTSTPSSSSTKHMKRWHSFKKLMAQRTHKKGSDDPKDTEVVEAEAGAGDSSTLDSKGENSGQKRWKLKRSWTFQGLKRDSSVVGLSKVAKGSDKDATDAKGEEPATADGEPAATGESEEAKVAEDGEAAEKAEGEEEKGAAAAGGTVSQHANEIWTSFKKRVTPKSKKPAPESAASGEEEGAAAAPSGDQEQTEDQASGKEPKTAKAKRTHFNRAVSLKNFILRKGKSTSVDQPDDPPKEGEEEAEGAAASADGEAEPAAGEAASAPGDSGEKATEAQVAADHTAEGGEEKPADATPAPAAAAPTPEKKSEAVAEPASAPVPAAPEVTTNGENGCTNGTTEDDATHNHESSPKKDDVNNTAAKKDAKMAKASQGNAVAQSEKKAGNV